MFMNVIIIIVCLGLLNHSFVNPIVLKTLFDIPLCAKVIEPVQIGRF